MAPCQTFKDFGNFPSDVLHKENSFLCTEPGPLTKLFEIPPETFQTTTFWAEKLKRYLSQILTLKIISWFNIFYILISFLHLMNWTHCSLKLLNFWVFFIELCKIYQSIKWSKTSECDRAAGYTTHFDALLQVCRSKSQMWDVHKTVCTADVPDKCWLLHCWRQQWQWLVPQATGLLQLLCSQQLQWCLLQQTASSTL